MKENGIQIGRRRCGIVFALIFVGVSLAFFSCSEREPKQSVLFITIDTLRADHLGCYGYPRDTSPSIDAFADEAIVFDNCVSQATSTLPAHVSIFTSLYPPAHGVTHNVTGLPEHVSHI